MVVLGQGGCIWAKVDEFGQSDCILVEEVVYKVVYSGYKVVFGQKWLYSGKVVVLGQKRLSSGKSGSNQAKVVVIGQKWL